MHICTLYSRTINSLINIPSPMSIEKLHLLIYALYSNELVYVYLLLGDLNNILCQCRWVFVSN